MVFYTYSVKKSSSEAKYYSGKKPQIDTCTSLSLRINHDGCKLIFFSTSNNRTRDQSEEFATAAYTTECVHDIHLARKTLRHVIRCLGAPLA